MILTARDKTSTPSDPPPHIHVLAGSAAQLVGGSEDLSSNDDGEEEEEEWADLVEVLMVGLRMRHGLDMTHLKATYGETLMSRARGDT